MDFLNMSRSTTASSPLSNGHTSYTSHTSTLNTSSLDTSQLAAQVAMLQQEVNVHRYDIENLK